jgi:hypothetical protein
MRSRVRPSVASFRLLPLVALGLTLALAVLISACDSGGSSKKKSGGSGPRYTKTHVLDPIVQHINDVDFVEADVPEDSVAMGIVSVGTLRDNKVIVHGFSITQGGDVLYITGPKNKRAPLSYSVDLNGDPDTTAINTQASAVLFPNDGETASLAAGTWTIPVATIDSAFQNFEPDDMTTTVYYKTETSGRPILKLNVWVVNGVNPAITTDAKAAADPEVKGALKVLENVYEKNDSTDVSIDVNVQYIADSSFDVIDTNDEMYTLAGSFPASPDNDAMNIFIVSSIDNLGAGTESVIGLALGLPGPFRQQGTAVSGTLAEYQSDGEGIVLGYILAHEFGHFLGLYHSSQTNSNITSIVGYDPISDTGECTTADLGGNQDIDSCPDRHNLMFPYVCDPSVDTDCDNPDVSEGQGNVVRYNPGVTP